MEQLAEDSDYVEGLMRIATRCIHVCCHLLSPREAAPLTSAATGLSPPLLVPTPKGPLACLPLLLRGYRV